jgi:hypothetical protein
MFSNMITFLFLKDIERHQKIQGNLNNVPFISDKLINLPVEFKFL